MHVVVAALSGRTSPSGVCRHAVNLALGLAEQSCVQRVTLLAGAWQVEYLRGALGLRDSRVEVMPVAIPNTALRRNLWYLMGLPVEAGRLGAEVVHLTFPMPVLRGMFAARGLMMTLHDLYPFDMPENFGGRAWMNRAALRLCLRQVDMAACVSAATQERLIERWPAMRRKSCVVPNAVRLPADEGQTPLPPELCGVPFVLCVAQHRANKNLVLLIEALDLARSRGDLAAEMRLVIAGHFGPETERLRGKVTRLGLEERVIFLRDLPDAQLWALYAACAMVVAPSLVEGFGLPVAEALSVGCRVVCSEIAAFREVGGEACVYFDARRDGPESLADAMREALTTATRPAMSFLTPAQAGERYAALYAQWMRRYPAERPAAVTEEKV